MNKSELSVLCMLLVLFIGCKEARIDGDIGLLENTAELVLDNTAALDSLVNPYTAYEESLLAQGFVDIHAIDSTIQVDLRYASMNNFMDTIIYDSLQHAFMHPETAKKLLKAQQILKATDSSLNLIVFDALRPRTVQYKLYEQVKGTAKQKYVASPGAGSMHNFGCAVDVSIIDGNGDLLDMGTIFDHFGPAAEYRNNWSLLKKGELTQAQLNNRKLLRDVMRKAVFVPIDSEWWHFNTFNRDYVRANFKVVD